ncbi:septum formation inhibitor Maf [Catenovulum sp. SM1970]|uniref:Maf family protein n=1 Tax=Marinifaba aquimaris TaxID=2741323 RepID=UPI0015726ED4|nr:Maf family protein [Marinifaba aquimaris]NTS77953.1 septum formation inhibitor Maf [Marinifaba aquimaris]
MHNRPIILASTSPFRKQILAKLNIPFTAQAPEVDETALIDETADALVERLAFLKAKAISDKHNQAIVIGSDQVAVVEGTILGKPGNFENAKKQLQLLSGKTVTFLTGLSIQIKETNFVQTLVEPFNVCFRNLSEQEIEHYLKTEQPYNCAGSFKSEGLGITLFEALSGKDPNTLIGLPLISLNQILIQVGQNPLLNQVENN